MVHYFQSIRAAICDSPEDLFSTPNQPLSHAAILICYAGSLDISINGEMRHVTSNSVLCCTPDTVVGRPEASTDLQCQCILIPAVAFHDALYEALRSERTWYNKMSFIQHHPLLQLKPGQLDFTQHTEYLFRHMGANISEAYRSHLVDIIAQGIILLILTWVDAEITNYESHFRTRRGRAYSNRQDNHLQGFMELLQEQKGYRREVTWYAQQLGLTPKYLAYVCKRTTDRTPLDLINEIAIREMKQLLLTTTCTIKQLASNMNFPNASMFCKYFRLHTGLTPLEFRAQSRQRMD